MRRLLAAALIVAAGAWFVVSGGAHAREFDLPEPASGGQVEVFADPSWILLGEGQSAKIEARLPEGATSVKMFAANGKLSDIETGVIGKASATYEPPEEFLPRVDIVAVRVETEDGLRWGYVGIQLVGQGDAQIKTRPFVKATIRIGDEEYGPVKANRKGKAKIHVKVPPGTLKGVDGEGGEVDLGIPELPRVALFAGAEELGIGDSGALDLFAVVHGADGSVDTEAEVVFKAADGEISGSKPLGGGAFAATLRGPFEAKGSVSVSVRPAGEGDEGSASVEVLIVPGSPSGEDNESDQSSEGDSAETGPATDPVPWFSVSAAGGFAWNLAEMKTFDVTVDLHIKRPFADHRFLAGAEVAFSRSSKESSRRVSSTRTTISSVLWRVPIGGVVGYRIALGERWALPIGVHLATVMVDSEIEFDPQGSPGWTEAERTYLFGIGGGAALEFELKGGAIFFEARFLGVIGEAETVDGRMSALCLDLGYRLFFL